MPKVQIPSKLLPILTKPKRIKIAVGGRGAGKSIAFADAFVKYCSDGERLCCAREFQNSIDDSVHSLLSSRANYYDAGLSVSASNITSQNGGEIFYKGLSRNPESIKSMFGVNKIWVEEASTLSSRTIDLLEPTIREDSSELWFSLNRGNSKDAFSQRFLKPYEKQLASDGYYEDDDVLIVQINYDDNPFFPDVLNKTRVRDYETLDRATYNHIWLGHYSDTIDNAIILPEWFDACIDAHKKLNIAAEGVEKVAYDPADVGDAKAYAYQHGIVVKEVKAITSGRIDEATNRVLSYANDRRCDAFIWDCDGIGMGLRDQVVRAFKGKHTDLFEFKGSSEVDRPREPYSEAGRKLSVTKTNKEQFANLRAQKYWRLRDRIYKTYQVVVLNEYIDRDELISFDSGISDLDLLRSELCSVQRKYVDSGKYQLVSKKDMAEDSPNCADAVMMLQTDTYKKAFKKPKQNYVRMSIA